MRTYSTRSPDETGSQGSLRRRSRFQGCAVVHLILGSVLIGGCSSDEPRYTYAQGTQMVNESVSALVDAFDPKPLLPAGQYQGDTGSCDGLDKDSDGRTTITTAYDLGDVPIGTSDAWFEQARRFWKENHYRVTVDKGSAGELAASRVLGAQQEDSGVSLVLRRSSPAGSNARNLWMSVGRRTLPTSSKPGIE